MYYVTIELPGGICKLLGIVRANAKEMLERNYSNLHFERVEITSLGQMIDLLEELG